MKKGLAAQQGARTQQLIDGILHAEQTMAKVAAAYEEAQLELRIAVTECRKAGWSWADIAKPLGCSRQAAWERFAQGWGIK